MSALAFKCEYLCHKRAHTNNLYTYNIYRQSVGEIRNLEKNLMLKDKNNQNDLCNMIYYLYIWSDLFDQFNDPQNWKVSRFNHDPTIIIKRLLTDLNNSWSTITDVYEKTRFYL